MCSSISSIHQTEQSSILYSCCNKCCPTSISTKTTLVATQSFKNYGSFQLKAPKEQHMLSNGRVRSQDSYSSRAENSWADTESSLETYSPLLKNYTKRKASEPKKEPSSQDISFTATKPIAIYTQQSSISIDPHSYEQDSPHTRLFFRLELSKEV